MDLTDPVATVLLVADALRRNGLAHALFGGLALAAYGEPRETRDADLAVVDVAAESARRALADVGIHAAVAFDDVTFGGLVLGRVTLLPGGGHTGLNVLDLVRPRSARFAAEALSRSIDAPLRDATIRVLAPEDFVVFKVLATRDRDVEDAATVLRRSGDVLDTTWIDTECTRLRAEIGDHDIVERWAEVRRRAAAGR